MAELSLAMVFAGTIGVFVVESGQSAFNVVFFRCLFGAISLALYCAVRGYLPELRLARGRFLLVLAGGAFIVFNWVFLFLSYPLTSITVATVVYHTQPFFVVLLGALVLREVVTRSKIGWVVVAFAGLLLVVEIDAATLSGEVGYLLGVGYALLAAVLYAGATIIAKHLKDVRPHVIALTQVSLGVVLLAPFVSLGEARGIGGSWGYLVTLGVLHTGVMYILMYSAFQKLATPAIAVLLFIYPAVAILADYVVYGTTVSPLQVVGILLIVTGSLGVNLGWNIPGLRPRERRAPVDEAALVRPPAPSSEDAG